ncbi:pre-peptidase C-terminal domain-containing protein [Kurthia senegalensis]|uniref:pre-peptidase C-terminal domain-containing protein n=1 Tax=Kurthia senegalensis TaxID=1033740 RepID=UPI000287E56A|nr:pre-peptidase C-terminal domain-containing protein [Kurthia senegalensis]
MKKIIFTLVFAFMLSVFCFKLNASAITSYSTASTISFGEQYSSSLPNYSTKHFYKISLVADGQIKVAMKNKTGSQWTVSVHDSNGNFIDNFETDDSEFASGSDYVKVGLAKGTYYIIVENEDDASGVTYQFDVNFTESPYFEKEFNDSVSTANAIALNKTYKGTISSSQDEDFYKVVLPKSGNIKIQIKNLANSEWRGDFLNASGKVLTSIYSDDSELVKGYSTVEVGLPKGTYYFKLHSGKYNAEYAFKLNYQQSEYFEKEQNDTITSANKIALNQYYQGTLQHNSDEDFYKFTLTTPGTVNLSLSTLPNSKWYVHLQNAKGEVYDYFYTSDSELVKGRASVNISLPKGTYYILVDGYSNTTDLPYTLKASFKASKTAYEKEFNNTLTTATPIKLNTNITGVINNQNDSDVDFYRFTVPATSNVRIRMSQKSNVRWYTSLYNSQGSLIHDQYTDSSELVKGNSFTTLRLKKGTYYYRVSNYDSAKWELYNFNIYLSTSPLSAKSITVKNYPNKHDRVTVKGVRKGSVVTIYNAKSKKIASATSKGTSVTLSIKQLGKKAGKIKVTVKDPGKAVSGTTVVKFAKE